MRSLCIHEAETNFAQVEEPLNETMCGCGDIMANPGEMGGGKGCECQGLVVRGRHHIKLGRVLDTRIRTRLYSHLQEHPVQLMFHHDLPKDFKQANTSLWLKKQLPHQVQLVHLNANLNKDRSILVRFAHLFDDSYLSAGRLSREISFDLRDYFKLDIKRLDETSLTGNEPIHVQQERLASFWGVSHASRQAESSFIVHLKPMDVKTFWILVF